MATTHAQPVLDIVSDVICPWCYIGKRRLGLALDMLEEDMRPQVRWRPYELNPTMPAGGMERRAYYAAKFGSGVSAEQLVANVSATAHNDGLEMDYGAIVRVPNTITAHRLIGFAGRHGFQDWIVDALFRAYFVEGRDIEDLSVLGDIAASAGLDRGTAEAFLSSDEDRDTVKAEARAAHDAGIQGVPAFLFNGRYLFSGAQSPETISLSIKRAAAKGL